MYRKNQIYIPTKMEKQSDMKYSNCNFVFNKHSLLFNSIDHRGGENKTPQFMKNVHWQSENPMTPMSFWIQTMGKHISIYIQWYYTH